MLRHKKSKHTEFTVNNHNEVDKILKCPHCELPASSQSNLNRHIRLKHPSDKKFICEECGDTFPRSDYFFKHQALYKKRKGSAKEDEPLVYSCNQGSLEDEPADEQESCFEGTLKIKQMDI